MFVKRGVLPGFGLSLGYTLLYLAFLVLLPLGALVIKAGGLGPAEFWRVATDPRAMAAYRLSFGVSLLAAAANSVFGVLVAWVLVRYSFPGRDLADALVDLPFALPTAVAGIALTAIYAPTGWLGEPLSRLGIQAAFSPLGIGVTGNSMTASVGTVTVNTVQNVTVTVEGNSMVAFVGRLRFVGGGPIVLTTDTTKEGQMLKPSNWMGG